MIITKIEYHQGIKHTIFIDLDVLLNARVFDTLGCGCLSRQLLSSRYYRTSLLFNMAKRIVAALLAAMPWMVESQAGKPVYAHFIVGIVENYTVDDWKADIAQAQAIGIDGFALNCAPERIDSYTPKQLANAYQAAEELNFKMFISFDFAYWSTGDTPAIIDIVGNYSSHPAQARYRFVTPQSTLFVQDYSC
ncbi:glycosyl hydrolase family 71-domain-containing protein [Xylaria telfairii]|nr:glycosyl hydrolase family 71-domain-containing protein [Xylaria telfairii]